LGSLKRKGKDMSDAPKRRSLFAADIALLRELQSMADTGTPIPFAELDLQQKAALLPQGEVSRLVKLQLARIKYDSVTYAPESVTIDPAKVTEFQSTIDAPPKEYVAPKARAKVEKPNVLANSFISICEPVAKPRNPGTDAGHNFNLYANGMTVEAYLNAEYDRNLRNKQGKWFNGPSYQLLYADMDAGNVWIHDQAGNALTKEQIAPRTKRQEPEAEMAQAAE